MRLTQRIAQVAVAAALLAAGGCYEKPPTALHKPGEYKGKRDSATIMRPDDAQRAALVQRFRTVQTDR